MSPLGAVVGASGANSSELVAGLAGEGRGKGLWATGLGLWAWLGRGAAGGAGTPVTTGGGRRGCPVRRASGREGQRAAWVASRGASGGGEAIQFRRSYAGVDVRRRASMGSTTCSGALVHRGQGSTFIRETAS
jgi:hypothetical protein